jgi:hypothetical protein
MSQPTAYTRQYDFSDFQASNPSTPLPATQIGAEYDAIKTTLDQILTNLALIQRDDTNLVNGSVGPDQLSTATRALLAGTFNIRGAWATATAYALLDLVTDSSTAYLCVEAHTSGTLATDISAGKWIVIGFEGAGNTISALNALTPAADRLPYFTGADSASLATLTAFGRTLIDDADAAAARTTLGLGALATAANIDNSNWSGADLAIENGGTGASSASAARTALGAAASGANTDITSLSLAEGSAPTTAAGVGALYTKDTSGQPELFFREESNGDEVQITSGGSVNGAVTESSGTWTPSFTFATPGDLSVSYSSRSGTYHKVGDLVFANFVIVTSAFTHTSASGQAQITGLPFTSSSVTGNEASGTVTWAGITKTNYTQVITRLSAGGDLITLRIMGSGQTNDNVDVADMPTGGTVVLVGSINYRAA